MTTWIAQPENQLLLCGVGVFLIGVITLLWLVFFSKPDEPIEIAHTPPEPVRVGADKFVWQVEPNYQRTEDAETDVIPVLPTDVFRMDEFYPLAEHFGTRVDAVTEVIEQVITRTTELVITIPEPESLYPARHRVEDLHGDTRPLGEAIRRAKEMAP